MYIIYTDSSICPFNPGGILTWAFIVKQNKEIVFQDTKIIGWGSKMTNNRGEMAAIVAAMLWLIKLPKEDRQPVLLNSDSQLSVNFCKGLWECKDKNLRSKLALIQKALKVYGKSVTFHWIPREKNEEADALSRSLYTDEAIQLVKDRKEDILWDGDDVSW